MVILWFVTLRGGVKSLIWTDTLKTICLVGSLILSIVFIANALDWSLVDAGRQIASSEYSQIFYFDDPSSPRYFWKMFFAGLFTLVAMTGLDQDMMQCNLSCVNYRNAQINIVITAVCQIFVILLFLALGAMLYMYSSQSGLVIPERGDELFSFVAFEGGLPHIVGILFILGLSASTYASAASSITALTTSFTVDIMGIDQGKSDVDVTRQRIIGHAVLSIVIGLLILCVGELGNESVINTMFKFVGYTYGPILGLFAFGIITPFRIRDKFVPFVVTASLIFSVTLEWCALNFGGYKIGFELLIYNALFTMLSLSLIIKNKKV